MQDGLKDYVMKRNTAKSTRKERRKFKLLKINLNKLIYRKHLDFQSSLYGRKVNYPKFDAHRKMNSNPLNYQTRAVTQRQDYPSKI